MSVMVSVICNTYNQEQYIKTALDGFIAQKTTFPFEVLVHDDASTDATAQIIREYAERYPELIKPIYQVQNQYSKNVWITEEIQVARAQGKYIAICEGDDYWTDPMKLQKQVDAMEGHPEIDICAHRVKMIRDGKECEDVPTEREQTVFPVEEVIVGGGGFVATASLLLRRELFGREHRFAKMMSLDYVWQINGALRGGMLYIGDCMGAYRVQANGSWSQKMQRNPEIHIRTWNAIKEMLTVFNEETNYQYAAAVDVQIAMMELNRMVRLGAVKELFSQEGRNLLRKQSVKRQILVSIQTIRRMLLNKLCR